MDIHDAAVDRVEAEYEKTLSLPEEKPARSFILCPIGVVGAGKTSVVRPLATRLSLVRISTDEIRKIFKEHGYGWDRVRELGTRLAEKYIRFGYSVALDADCLGRAQQLKDFSKENSVPLVWIKVDAPEEFIIQKLARFSGPSIFASNDAVIQNYRESRLRHEKEPFTEPFVCIFDTSRDDLPQQVAECSEKITEAMRR